MQPRPIGETVSVLRPSVRCSMPLSPSARILLQGRAAGGALQFRHARDRGGRLRHRRRRAGVAAPRDRPIRARPRPRARRRQSRRRRGGRSGRVGAARAGRADGRVVSRALRGRLSCPRRRRGRCAPHGLHRRGEPASTADARGGSNDPRARAPRGRPHEQLGGRRAASHGRAPRALRRLRGVGGGGPAKARPAYLRARVPRAPRAAVARRVPRRHRHEPQTGARSGHGHDQGGRPGPGAPRARGAPRGRPLAHRRGPLTDGPLASAQRFSDTRRVACAACYNGAMTKMTKTLSVGSAGVDATVSVEIKPIPFQTELSLAPLLAFWARTFGDDTSLEGTFARTIREATEAAPELLAPITDPSVIDRHRKLVDMLMAAVFPAAVLDREYGAAIAPFQLRGFYATPPFEQLFLAADGSFHGRMNIEPSTLNAMRLLRAYGLVLARVYSIELDLDYSFIFTVADPEVLSSLKRDLIDKESIVSNARFLALQQKLRTLFRRPELRFGLAALSGDQVLILNYGAKSEHACIFADSRHHTKEEFKGSVYERAVRQGSPLVIDDLTAMPGKTAVDDEIVQSGARNLVVAPLLYQGRVIGTFELESPHPGDLNATHLPKLHEVLPLFSMAVQRSMEELNNRIQALIKEKCTAIHPVVEWRFRQAVLKSIERHTDDAGAELEPIVFERVHPLYALSDIRSSSLERSLAIQADVLAQLRLAREVVQDAHAAKRLPALDELLYRVSKYAAKIEKNLNSGDEASASTFLRGDPGRLLDHLHGCRP